MTKKINLESTISSLQLLSLGLKQCIAYLLKAKVKKAGTLTNQGKVYVSTRILVRYQVCHMTYQLNISSMNFWWANQSVQLNFHETNLLFQYLSHHLTWYCLLFFPVLVCCDHKIVLHRYEIKTKAI